MDFSSSSEIRQCIFTAAPNASFHRILTNKSAVKIENHYDKQLIYKAIPLATLK